MIKHKRFFCLSSDSDVTGFCSYKCFLEETFHRSIVSTEQTQISNFCLLNLVDFWVKHVQTKVHYPERGADSSEMNNSLVSLKLAPIARLETTSAGGLIE